MKTTYKKVKTPKKSFAQKLFTQLLALGIKAEVEIDGDEDGVWVSYRLGNKVLSFTFDKKGNKMDDVSLFQDVIQVVGQNKIF